MGGHTLRRSSSEEPIVTAMTASGLADPRLHSDLARAVRRRLAPTDVDDVVQSTLAEALRAPSLPEAYEELRRFVFAIARQKVAAYYRRRELEQRNAQRVAEEPPMAPPSNDLLHWAARAIPQEGHADETLEWMLRESEGETLAEIASSAQVPPTLVRKRVSRLRQHLRSAWSKEAAAMALLGLVLGGVALARCDHAVGEDAPTATGGGEVTADTASKLPMPAQGNGAGAAQGRPFDRGEAVRALAQVDYAACATPSTPPGPSHFRVIFVPDGSVSAVTVDSGVAAGRPEGACIATSVRKVHVPPFDGSDVTVGKSVTLVTPSP
jgi:DNA-directed RNA polymerase specialized sigma24 family protein